MKNKITILGNLIFDNWFLFVINTLIYIYCKHSKKCTFYILRFGCSFAAVNTIKPQLL